MWQILLQIGSLAGLLSLLGGSYLYFENRQLKKMDATKEYQIAQADVREFDEERAARLAELEDMKRGAARGVSFEANRPFWESVAEQEQNIKFSISAAEAKARARANYYKQLKNHRFLWFLRRKKDHIFFE